MKKRLPAPVAAATAAAITAVAVTPTTTAATAAAAASATATTTASAAAATATCATAATFTRWTGFIYDNVAAHEIVAVKSLNGAFGFVIALHLNESKPTRLAGKTVAHQGDNRRGDSRLRK